MFASDYRRMAREALRGKWKSALRVMLLAQAVFLYFGLDILYISFFAQPIYFEFEGMAYWFNSYYACTPMGVGWLFLAVLLLFDCVSAMVTVGQYRVMAGLYRGETPTARQLFPWNLFGKALLMNIVRGLLVFAWSLLFVIPGIVAVYRYSMADYLLAENPELGPIEVLRESRARMMGRKWGLFCLQLSFFGWALLASLVELLLNALLFNNGTPEIAVGSSFIYTLCVWLLSAPLNTYMLAAEAAFFGERTFRASEPKVDISGEYVGAKFGGSEDVANAERERYGAETEASDEGEQGFPEPDVDESVARDMFRSHGCSRKRLRDEGLWEGYEALRPYPASEAAWRREYADELMRRFDRDPEALGELLDLCAEYADDQLANRVLARIDRHIRQQTLPDEEILNMAGRTLAMLISGAFTDESFLARRREQVRDMADRLESRLREADPDGNWQSALQLVREMCEGRV